MKEEKDHIGDFFKEELHDQAVELSRLEHERISSMISKNGFYYFSVHRFNIYYAAAIAVGLVVSMLVAGNSFLKERQEKRSTALVQRNEDTVLTQSKNASVQAAHDNHSMTGSGEHFSKQAGSNEIEKRVSERNSVAVTLSASEEFKVAIPTSDTIVSPDSVKKTVVERKKIYIVKKDTVYKIDTLPAKARRKIKKEMDSR